MTVVDGWLQGARRVLSPNHDPRPDGVIVDLLVIHGISLPPGQFGGPGIDQLFTNTLNPDAHPFYREIMDLRVAAHLLIRRDGELVQYVDLDRRARHAGVSCFDGRENCNDFSIGIELEGTDDLPYSNAQYDALNQVINSVRAAYPAITPERIVGHCDIAPGRKTDPGPMFEWNRVKQWLSKGD